MSGDVRLACHVCKKPMLPDSDGNYACRTEGCGHGKIIGKVRHVGKDVFIGPPDDGPSQ